jgi:hypothetical protein
VATPEDGYRCRYDVATGRLSTGPWDALGHPLSRLESKALLAGLHPDQVRDYLRAEVARRANGNGFAYGGGTGASYGGGRDWTYAPVTSTEAERRGG